MGSLILLMILSGVAAVMLSNVWVAKATEQRIYSDISAMPERAYGLVLGTRAKVAANRSNLYFEHRMDTAAALYHAGKVRHLLLSGANPRPDYNEPADMRAALIKRGVPEQAISLDYAGFRTLDSIVRAKKVFSMNDFTIISQGFHNQRALFICDYYGIKAQGFNAPDVPFISAPKVMLREHLARFKAVLDLYILKTQPRFLGDKVKLPSVSL